MTLISCSSCGVVLDLDSHALECKVVFNHDQDKKGTVAKCPLCKGWIEPEVWTENK